MFKSATPILSGAGRGVALAGKLPSTEILTETGSINLRTLKGFKGTGFFETALGKERFSFISGVGQPTGAVTVAGQKFSLIQTVGLRPESVIIRGGREAIITGGSQPSGFIFRRAPAQVFGRGEKQVIFGQQFIARTKVQSVGLGLARRGLSFGNKRGTTFLTTTGTPTSQQTQAALTSTFATTPIATEIGQQTLSTAITQLAPTSPLSTQVSAAAITSSLLAGRETRQVSVPQQLLPSLQLTRQAAALAQPSPQAQSSGLSQIATQIITPVQTQIPVQTPAQAPLLITAPKLTTPPSGPPFPGLGFIDIESPTIIPPPFVPLRLLRGKGGGRRAGRQRQAAQPSLTAIVFDIRGPGPQQLGALGPNPLQFRTLPPRRKKRRRGIQSPLIF